MSEILLVTKRHENLKKIPGEELMRKFSRKTKQQCKYVTNIEDLPPIVSRPKRNPTGSTYTGTRDHFGINGLGVYCFPDGWIYNGYFEDGELHGFGELTTTHGELVRGIWIHGKLQSSTATLFFRDGLEFKEFDWNYIRMPDRRFHVEMATSLQPAPMSYKTAQQPTKIIPPGHIDTCTGFYNIVKKAVFEYHDLDILKRSPKPKEQKWIEENCRNADDSPVGFHPGLYEEFYRPTKYLKGDTNPNDENQDLYFTDKEFQERWQVIQESNITLQDAFNRSFTFSLPLCNASESDIGSKKTADATSTVTNDDTSVISAADYAIRNKNVGRYPGYAQGRNTTSEQSSPSAMSNEPMFKVT